MRDEGRSLPGSEAQIPHTAPGLSSASLLSVRREVFPLRSACRIGGLRGNINIFLAADLPRAGMQKIASA